MTSVNKRTQEYAQIVRFTHKSQKYFYHGERALLVCDELQTAALVICSQHQRKCTCLSGDICVYFVITAPSEFTRPGNMGLVRKTEREFERALPQTASGRLALAARRGTQQVNKCTGPLPNTTQPPAGEICCGREIGGFNCRLCGGFKNDGLV